MLKVANIAKNTSYLTLALVIQKIISFTYFIILARFLGLESLGQYYTALAFTTVFAIFIDLGFANALTREVAKDQSRASAWLRSVLGMKILLSIFTVLLGLTIAFFAYDPIILALIAVASISMVLDSFTNTFFSVIRGFHNLKYESIAAVLFQLFVFIFGLLVIFLAWPLLALMTTLVLASAFNFFYSLLVVKRKLKLKINPSWNLIKAWKILLLSLPFALYNIFQRLFTYLDSLLLGFIAGYAQVGIYQIAFKLIFALQFLPMAFTASLYPAMSSYWQNNREQLKISFERALNYLLILVLPIIFGVFSLAEKIVPLFKAGDEAIWPLRISILALFFIFLNFPVGSLLNACDRQKKNTTNMGIAMIFSVFLNIILIPIWQAIGASVTVLLSNFLMLILGFTSIKGLINYNPLNNLKLLFKGLLSSLLMLVLIFFIKQYVHIFVVVILAGIIYFFSLFLLGAVKKSDLDSVIKSFKLR